MVWNCDLYSLKDGVSLGGMNENWIFAYNRFRVKQGGGFLLGSASFDHIIRGNTFILEDGQSPLLLYKTSDSGGIELEDNRICGGTALASGLGKPQVDRDNRLLPRDAPAPRPTSPVPSLYEWQKQHSRNGQRE